MTAARPLSHAGNPLAARPIGGAEMKRINLAAFVRFGDALHPLAAIRTGDAPLEIGRLRAITPLLAMLLDEKQMPLSLKASRASLEKLDRLVKYLCGIEDSDARDKALKLQESNIWLAAYELEKVLDAELAVQPTFHVWPKRAYDTDKLVSEGEAVFSPIVRDNLTSQEKYDVQQAGRCLAFEVPTAAAFHIFRAAESVLRRYYGEITGSTPKPKMRNWGAYIKILQKSDKADPKILFALGEVKDMCRNPIMHPETNMDIEEALSLLGLADTLIGGMVAALPKRESIADRFLRAGLTPPPLQPALPSPED
jgi:hypothetical protein